MAREILSISPKPLNGENDNRYDRVHATFNKANTNFDEIYSHATLNLANYYIDPDTGTGAGDGSFADPYASWDEVTLENNATYYQKKGTTALLSYKINLQNLSNVTIGSYGTATEKPIIQFYKTLTNTGDFTEVATNIWKYSSGREYWSPHILLGLGSLGDRDSTSYTQRVNYLGGGTGSTSFTAFGQWEKNNGSTIGPVEAVMYIYADANPVTKWGTIYYITGQDPTIHIKELASNIIIKDLHFKYGYSGVYIEPFNSQDLTDVIVENCTSEHTYFGFEVGATTGTLLDTIVRNNETYVSGNIGIKLKGTFGVGVEITGNTITDTGYQEGIGGIYIQSATGLKTLIENNNIINVYEGIYWNGEAYALYCEHSCSSFIWRRNYAEGSSVGMVINGGSTNVVYISNIIVDCDTMFVSSDSTPIAGTEVFAVCNNIGINVEHGLEFFRPSTAGTLSAKIRNNICYSDGTGGSGFRISANVNTMGAPNENYNCIYGFTIDKELIGTGPIALGANDITTNPLFVDITDERYTLQISSSPCIGTGVRWWGGAAPIGYDSITFDDNNTDMGAYQATSYV